MFKGFQLKNSNKRKLVESKAGDPDEKDDVEFKKVEIIGAFDSTVLAKVETKPLLVIPLPADTTSVPSTSQSKDVEVDNIVQNESKSNHNKGGKYTSILMAHVNPDLDDSERFKSDILHRADDVDFKSDIYRKIPVEEFGAAMLRGMGWTEPEKQAKEPDNDYKTLARDPKLGLGAKKRDGSNPAKK